MRSRPQDKADPAFLDEKTARKQAERQLVLDALSGRVEAEAIEWTASNAIPPEFLTSPRIRLRQWTEADCAPFAAMNADPVVMEYFPATLTREQSDATVERFRASIDRNGWGFWAADDLTGGEPRFAGFVGINIPQAAELPFQPCVEVGWRLARPFWGKGLASEGARLSLRVGFELLGLEEIVAMTQLRNLRSRAVMERLGMREAVGEEFEHPAVPVGSHARAMCLYRLKRPSTTN
jgi:RimJ/RimL family protein N-acetyltransferase